MDNLRHSRGGLAMAFLFGLQVLSLLSAAEYWVAPGGSDSTGTGSQTQPWATLQKAANTAAISSVIHVADGAYQPLVIRRSGLRFVAINRRGPVIDGAALVPGDGSTQLVSLQGVSDAEIDGFTVRNLTTTANSANTRYLDGIQVTGSCQRIAIRNCLVSGIRNQHPDPMRRQAHGILVYASSPMSDITVSGNEVTGCVLGYSESVTLNGNISGFAVEENFIHDNDNIGLDIAGGYGASAVNDYARGGIVRRNTVQRCTSRNNPAYGGSLAAAGIYLDGGWNTVVEQNHVEACDFGLSISAENLAWTAQGNTVRNNLIRYSNTAGLNLGGAAPGQHGIAIGNAIVHNTFYSNSQGSGLAEIFFANSHSNLISGNILCSTGGYIYAVWAPATLASSGNNTIDHNLHWSTTGSPRYVWYDQELNGIAAFRQATIAQGAAKDGASLVADPLFVAIASGDPRLLAGSLARDRGSLASGVQAGSVDLFALNRLSGSARDVGACEYQATAPPPPISQATFGNNGNPWAIAGTGTTRVECENYDLGGEGIAYHDLESANLGGSYRTDGVDLSGAIDTGGGHNVGWVEAGEWLEYTVSVATAGTYTTKLRIARETGGNSSARLLSNGTDVSGTIAIPSTGAWQTWTDVTIARVNLQAGPQVLRLQLDGGLMNVNWLEFSRVTPPVGLPAGWSTVTIGNATPAGAATHANGLWTVSGAGADIWDTADSFAFVAQSLTGNGTIVARVTGLQNTNPWAKAGVMIRDGTPAGATHAFCCVTASQGVAVQRRRTMNGASIHTAGSFNSAPRWVKLVRSGASITGYESADGSIWTQIVSTTITMSNSVRIGLAVTSHANGTLCTATFTDVTITPTAIN